MPSIQSYTTSNFSKTLCFIICCMSSVFFKAFRNISEKKLLVFSFRRRRAASACAFTTTCPKKSTEIYIVIVTRIDGEPGRERRISDIEKNRFKCLLLSARSKKTFGSENVCRVYSTYNITYSAIYTCRMCLAITFR